MSSRGQKDTRVRAAEQPRNQNGKTIGRPRQETVHEQAARLQREGHLPPETAPTRGEYPEPVNPGAHAQDFNRDILPGSAEFVRDVIDIYGEHQLGASLSNYTPATIRATAHALGIATEKTSTAGNTRPIPVKELLSAITAKATGGRYSANFPTTKRGGGTARAKSPRNGNQAPRAARTPKAEKARQELVPIVPAGTLTFDRDEKPTAYSLQRLYGNSQLRAALSDYTLSTLKGMAQDVQGRNPGTRPKSMTRKQDVLDYMVGQLAPGF